MKQYEDFLSKMICESPYKTEGDFGMKIDSDISPEAVHRDFIVLDKKEFPIGDIALLAPKNEPMSFIRIVREKQNRKGRFDIIGQLEFKDSPSIIPGMKKMLQVNGVFIQQKYRSSKIVSTIYRSLVLRGYTVVSDSTQFPPGVGLWKSIAHESSFNNHFKVYIYNTETKEFIVDKNKKKISYNGNNIPDKEIWTDGWDFGGEKILMVLTK